MLKRVRESLIFKLLGAFLLVTLVGGLVMFGMISRATQGAFQIYTTRSGKAWAERAAPILAGYYQAGSGWTGVDNFLKTSLPSQLSSLTGEDHSAGQGAGAGRAGGGMAGGGMAVGGGSLSSQRFILTDQNAIVIGDTTGELLNQKLSTAMLAVGTPVTAAGQTVGVLLVAALDFANPDSPSGQFIASVNQFVIVSVAVASLIALLLGAGLFFQITAPLRQLQKAAAAIARGNYQERVQVRARDELSELGISFNQMAESLDQAREYRRRMVADIAHELRTPLTVIQVNLEGMLDGVLPLDREQLEVTHTETLLLNRLVGDLRLLSLAEAGELKLEQQETDLADLVRRAVEHLSTQARQKGIMMTAECRDDLLPVFIDSDRITQVLSNLIGNALRYTPAGGQITVCTAASIDNPGFVVVSVTDSGSGIQPQALPFIFDRFYRADKSRDRSSGGSGLGLAIVKQLVEAHGGHVWAKSPVFLDSAGQGYGTEISFTLPVHSA